MATEKAIFCSQRRFSALASAHHAVQPVGCFGLLVGVKMAVGFHRGLHALMPQPLRDQERGEAHLHQQAGVGMPLRYNKDKRKNPVFSRVSAFVVAYSIPFPTLIVNEKSVE